MQASFWETTDFPDAQEVPELPSDDTSILNVPQNACPTCGEEVVRQPGSRGRLPKYHPECKPSTRKSDSSRPRVIRVSKDQEVIAQQIEQAVEKARMALAKGVALLSLADPFDAFVLHVNSQEILVNVRGALESSETLRRWATATGAGFSIFSLILTVFTTVLPIAAHHNVIPSKRVTQIMINMPFFMLRMQKAAEAAEDGDIGGELIRRIKEQAKLEEEAAQRRKTEDESPNGYNR